MKKLDKKAFTLIEILATVTILGILSVVAMVNVNKIIQNAKEKHYTNAEEQLELAGQSYSQQHRSVLPKAIGQKVKIPMKKLVDTNYIEQIKDYSDNGCDMEKSYVQIFKYSQSDYSYLAYLECPVYKSNEHLKEAAPNIVLNIKGDTMGEGDKKDEKQQLEIRINNPSDEGTIEKPSKLISYSYTIYRYDKEVKNSGSVSLSNYDTRLDKTIDLTLYSPGRLKIVVTATNIYGLTTTKTITTDFKDVTPPECIIDEVDQNPKPWVKNEVKITVGCKDENGSGCEREKYTKTFKSSTDYNYITIKDNEGNTKQCKVSVFLDITRPTIKVTAYKRTASGGKTGSAIGTMTANHDNPNMTLDLTDVNTTKWLNSISNPNGVYYEVTYSDGESTVKYEAKENAANLLATDSTVNNMTIIDNGQTSGKKLDTKYSTTIDGHRLYTLHASDEIGNYVDLKIISPFDKTPPTTPTLQNPYKQSDGTYKWSIADYSVILTSQDVLSGIESFQYTYKAGATEVTGTNTTGYKKYDSSSASPKELKAFTATPFSKDRNQKYYARVCDVAGNCSGVVDTLVKLDKTKPTCSINVATSGVTLSSKSDPKTNDVNSGLAQYGMNTSGTVDYNSTESKDISKTTFYGYVIDNAGNTNTCSKRVYGTDYYYECSSGSLSGTHCYSYTSATPHGHCYCWSSSSGSLKWSYSTTVGSCSCNSGEYSTYSASYYSCSSGTLTGSQCRHDKGEAYKVYYCSDSGTKLNNTYCYK